MSNDINAIGTILGTDVDKASKFKIDVKYEWIDPPIYKFLGTYFPSETTYHPLLNHSDYEIASNLFSIRGAPNLSDQKKTEYEEKVERIVKDSYYLNAYGNNNFSCLILIMLALFLLFSGNVAGYYAVLFLTFCVFIYNNLMGYPSAKAMGTVKWNEFINSFSAEINSGNTPKAILEKYKQDRDRENALQAQLYAQSRSNTAFNLAFRR
jgi:hypothetical protein